MPLRPQIESPAPFFVSLRLVHIATTFAGVLQESSGKQGQKHQNQLENVEVAPRKLEVDRLISAVVCAKLRFPGRIFGVEARHFDVAGAIFEVRAGNSRFDRLVLMFRADIFRACAAIFEHVAAGFEVARDSLDVAPVRFQVPHVIE